MQAPQEQRQTQNRAIDARLGREQTVWLATTRADGRPHLAPVWFVWRDDKVYLCTTVGSQKLVNMQRNRRAVVALPDTAHVLIIEGQVDFPRGAAVSALAQQFNDKYGWNFLDDPEEWQLVEITPTKFLTWSPAEE